MTITHDATLTTSNSYRRRRAELMQYFDATAAETWARLTSDAPVSKVRETVRNGRDAMRGLLLGWLPEDIAGARILDAGCGTGALSIELARRGAQVLAIDVARSLVEIAEKRSRDQLTADEAGQIGWLAGDMLDPTLGRFDYVVAMDSLIHYRQHDMADAVARLAARADRSLLTTFAPRTRMLAMMHAMGTVFPAGDRSPRIEPVPPTRLVARLVERGLTVRRRERVKNGFYISEAVEVAAA